MNPTHIIWDWNGTLLDDVEACVQSVNCMLATRQLPTLSTDLYRDIFDFPVQAYYEKLGFDVAHEDWDQIAEEFHVNYKRFSKGCTLRHGVEMILSETAKRGVGSSILSASEQKILQRMLTEQGIQDAFEHVHGLDNLHAASKLERGHALIEALDIEPAAAVLIGDTLHDHDVAQQLGCDCILLTGGHNSAQRLRSVGRRVLTELVQLEEILIP
jgi:phosphoglycolate phosphatase